ncbi:MAG: ATP-binding protein [Granulosicoccus sp.]
MADSSMLILDFIGLLGGGRGSPLQQLAPHVLGAIFWGSLSVAFALLYTGRRNPTDSLLLTSFIILLTTEFSLLVSNLLLIEGYMIPIPPPLETLWSSLEWIGGIVGRILLSAAFLQIVLGQRELTINYLKVGIGVVALSTIFYQSSHWLPLIGNGELRKLLQWEYIPLFTQLPVTLMFGFAALKTLGSLRKIRWPILIGLSSFLLDSILRIIIMQADANLGPVLDPFRGHLQLWPIMFIAYVALRVRHVEGQRLQHGIQANERLEALGQLSSGIAHDFNNHLQIILGYTELAKANGNLDLKHRLPLNRIEEAAESAGALVNQLLAFSRGQPPKFVPVDLNEIITRLTPMLSRLLGPDIRLMQELDLNSKKILADVPMIEQLIINLVVNSKDAITGNGIIALQSRSLSKHDANRHTGEAGYERTQLLISDNGIGMDEKTVRRVFEPFFTTKSVGQGTGLGLSTVYSTVQKHNGTVFIKSEPNKFTRVYIEFPVCTDSDSLNEIPEALQMLPVARGETILLAEDETAIRDLARTLLQGAGYNVLVARDGQHAVNIMRTYKAKIDLCLFDVTMPVLNGYDTYDCVATDHPDTPVLFVTGNTSRVAHVRSHLPHLQKPFSKYNLFSQVRSVLDEAVDN